MRKEKAFFLCRSINLLNRNAPIKLYRFIFTQKEKLPSLWKAALLTTMELEEVVI